MLKLLDIKNFYCIDSRRGSEFYSKIRKKDEKFLKLRSCLAIFDSLEPEVFIYLKYLIISYNDLSAFLKLGLSFYVTQLKLFYRTFRHLKKFQKTNRVA